MRSGTRRFATAVGVAALALLARPETGAALWVPDGVAVARTVGDQVQPFVIPDGRGGAIIAWSDSRHGDSNFDVYAQRVNARGVPLWGANGLSVCRAAGDQFRPVAVPDGAGGAVIAWVDARNGGLDVFAQRISASGVPSWATDGIAVCDAAGDQYSLSIVSDGSGGAIVAWQDYRNGAEQRDVFAQRVDAAGAARWAPLGVSLGSSNRGGLPATAQDGAGGAIVAWEDSISVSERDIRAQRVDAGGNKSWAAGGTAVATVAGAQVMPRIVPSGDGAIILWTDDRSGTPAVYAQRIGGDGAVRWTGDGEPVSPTSEEALSPAAAAASDGGVIVGWVDYRNGGSAELFAQRIDSLGVGRWAPGGIPVSDTPGDQLNPVVDTDGAGGVVIAWFEFTASVGADIYAQRVDSAGVAQWGPSGTPVCTSGGLQAAPAISAVGGGRSICAWQDLRGGTDQDIFAAQLLPGGGTIEIPATPYASQAAPNPFRSGTLLEFGLSSPGRVRIRVFDLAGRVVVHLLDGGRPAGIQGVTWDGRGDRGTPVGSGTYFATVEAEGVSRRFKLTLVR